MIVSWCPQKNCKYCYVDPKAEKERFYFGLTEGECPDVVECCAPGGECVLKNAQPLTPPTQPIVKKKCLLVKEGEKTILYAQEGTDLFDFFMGMQDGAISEYNDRYFMRQGDNLAIFRCVGRYNLDGRWGARYSRVFFVPLKAMTLSEWKEWRAMRKADESAS